MLKRGTMQKAFIDMADDRTAKRVIKELDGYEFIGQYLEVRFSDQDTAQQYPKSKRFGNNDRDYKKGGRGYDDYDDYYDKRGNKDGGLKRRNTYDNSYNKGGNNRRNNYDDYDDYYDYGEYDDENDKGRNYGGNRGGYNKRNDSRGGYRGGYKDDYKKSGEYSGKKDRSQGGKSFYDKSSPEQTQAENEERVLYVNNLSYSTDENSLTKAFEKCGAVEKVSIGYRRDGRSQGNATVQFKTKDAAADAIKQLDGEEVDGRAIKVKVYQSYENYQKTKQ